MDNKLSTGRLAGAFTQSDSGHLGATKEHMVVQCLGVKEIQGKDKQPRFRILISDGVHFGTGMLASQLTEKVSNGELVEGSILRLMDYLPNTVSGRKILILLQLEVLGRSEKIGDPRALEQRVSPVGAQGQYPNSGPSPAQTPGTSAGSSGPYGQGSWTATGIYGQGGQPRPQMANSSYGNTFAGGRGPSSDMSGLLYGQESRQSWGGDRSSMAGGASAYGSDSRLIPQAMPGGQYGVSGGSLGPPSRQFAPQYNLNRAGPIARDEAPVQITQISHLNPYMNRWTIKGRCTSKSDLRRWSNVRGEGKVFSFDLLDVDGGEIRVTAFNDEADRYHEIVEVGAIYTLSKASLVQKKPQFNSTNHQFEIRLERQSVLECCPEDNTTSCIPRVQYQFKDIASIQNLESGSIVDVIAVVDKVAPWQKITKRNGDEAVKRPVIIKDKSMFSIEITLWGNFVSNPGELLEQDCDRHPVIAVKGARVGDFSGKNLSTISTTQVAVDPLDIHEAAALRQWFDHAGGSQAQVASLSNMRGSSGGQNAERVTLDSLKGMLGEDGQSAYCQVAATVFFIRNENMYYPACPLEHNGRQCFKKLREEAIDRWFCERCQNHVERPCWRYILSLTLKDHTGQQIVTAFGEQAEEIMGMPAETLREIEGTKEFDHAVVGANFSERLFTLRVHEETYNDEKRTKVSVARQERIDFSKESQILFNATKAIMTGGAPQQASTIQPYQQHSHYTSHGGTSLSNGMSTGSMGMMPQDRGNTGGHMQSYGASMGMGMSSTGAGGYGGGMVAAGGWQNRQNMNVNRGYTAQGW